MENKEKCFCSYCGKGLRPIKRDYLWDGNQSKRKYHKTCYKYMLDDNYNAYLNKKYGNNKDEQFILLL